MGDTAYQKTITLKDALALAHKYGKKITKATLTEWMDQYHKEHNTKLYHQPKGVGGKIYVYEEDFEKFISGKREEGDK